MTAFILSVSFTLSASTVNPPPQAPFDRALLAGKIPEDLHEARVLIAMLKLRGQRGVAQGLETWLPRRETRRLYGEGREQFTIQEALTGGDRDMTTYDRDAAARFERTFPVNFLETAPPDLSQGPGGTVPEMIAPGAVAWTETNQAPHVSRYDVTLHLANELDVPVKLRVDWILAGALFNCGPLELTPASSVVTTCSASAINVNRDGLIDGLVALRQGRGMPATLVRRVQAPSRGVALAGTLREVRLEDDGDMAMRSAERAEASRRLAAIPCESLDNCEQRREMASGPQGSRVAQFLIWGLGFAGALVFRIYRPAPARTSVTVAWVVYAAAGVLAIVLSLADPPQTGGGDGMVHGAVGQLLMYALGAPWSLIIAQGHGHDAGTVSGFLMMAVLANILYSGAHVFLLRRDSWH